jgi:NAD(P)H-flavin reductase
MNDDEWAKGQKLILICGGVGVNPFISMLAHVCGWLDTHTHIPNPAGFHITFVQSAATQAELLFYTQTQTWAKQFPSILSPHYIVTRPDTHTHTHTETDTPAKWEGRTERLDAKMLWSLLPADAKERENVCVYVCGPPGMIDMVEKIYCEEGENGKKLEKEQVRAEKWW